MAKIISKIDITLKIPPYFKGLTGREPLEIELKKNIITSVPDKVADYYIRSNPKKYRYADQEDFELYTEEEKKEPPPAEFNALEFFGNNAENIEEAVNELNNKKQIDAICKFMGLTNYVTQTNERKKERIIADIKVQKEQQEKIDNKK